MTDDSDIRWMRHAIDLAKLAEQAGEVPVGAVIIKDDKIIGEGWNQPISSHDPSAHAEMIALRAAGSHLMNYRLTEVTMYVTLEPCVMCTGALVHARVDKVIYGASDTKAGAFKSCFKLVNDKKFNHKIDIESGVLGDECGNLLKRFFEQKRSR